MNNYYKLIAAWCPCPCPGCIETDIANPSGDGRLAGLRHGVTGSPPPLPDEALVLINVFSDHVRLDTKVVTNESKQERREGDVGMTRVVHRVSIYSTETRPPMLLGPLRGRRNIARGASVGRRASCLEHRY